MTSRKIIVEKLKEAVAAVLPITLIVAVMCFFLVPVDAGLMLSFVVGAVMLIAGMGLFTVGSEISMTQIGTHMGAHMTKSRKLWLILSVSFVLGAAITVAEPDLQVLATNVPAIDTTALIIAVSVGVGIFLMLCMVRILLGIPLRWLLLICYGIIFLLAAFCDIDMLSVAFDSGGVTTGPMTVPFIMALGVGVASIRSDKNAKADSFGLVALCSIGPILAVMILGFIYSGSTGDGSLMVPTGYANTVAIGADYIQAIPHYLYEMAMAILPIFAFFLIFQLVGLHLPRLPFIRILIGIILTYIGLVLFLTGVNVGFSSLGFVLGREIVVDRLKFLLVPLAMLMGWFIIRAEPAVHVLNKQVEDLSAGAISAKAMGTSLSVAIALANGLAMVRVLTGVSIMWFLIPGYTIALTLSFFVPQTFTSIAFDSGGVASGPMTATFMLPFAMGVCGALGGNVMTDAFGLVAMVAMTPLITVQIMGAIAAVKAKRGSDTAVIAEFGDNDIIELWEVA